MQRCESSNSAEATRRSTGHATMMLAANATTADVCANAVPRVASFNHARFSHNFPSFDIHAQCSLQSFKVVAWLLRMGIETCGLSEFPEKHCRAEKTAKESASCH